MRSHRRWRKNSSGGKLSISALVLFGSVFYWAGTSAPQSLKPMVFAVSAKDLSASPIFIAERLGYFKEEGIDAKVVLIRSDIAMKGLVTDDVNFASSISSVVKAAAIGAPMKTVINFFNGSFFYLVTRPDITSMEQLRGKKLAISRHGSATDFDARAVVRRFGLDPSKDVNILAVGGGPTRIAALVSGHVDAAILNNIEKLPAEKAGMRTLLFTGQYLRQPVGGLGTSTHRIHEKSGDVRRAIKAVYKALVVMKNDRNAIKGVFDKELGVKAEQFDGVFGDAMRVFLADGKIDLQDLAAPYDDARKQAANPPEVPLTAVVDYTILDEVRRSMR